MSGRLLLLLAGVAMAQVPDSKVVPPAPPQPLPFSHKTHAAAGLKCAECHPVPEPGDLATFPKTATCMACHIAVKKDSPYIARLAAYHREGKAIAWARVYRVADYVWFSHKQHLSVSGVTCATCHGPVEQRDVLRREKDLSMAGCMECHRAKGASNDCLLCHEQR
jgi:cell division septation protein DedD